MTVQSLETTALQKQQLIMLDEWAVKFVEMKKHFIDLKLKSRLNVGLALQYFDDGFLRAREAIFATEESESVVANSIEPLEVVENKIAS